MTERQLFNTFNNIFTPIISIAIVSSFIITILLINLQISSLNSDIEIKSIILDNSLSSSFPSLYSAQSLIFKLFQDGIDANNLFEEYILNLERNLNNNTKSVDEMKTFIKNYGKNAKDVFDSYNNNSTRYNKSELLSKGVWYISRNKTNVDSLDYNETRELYILLNGIPLYRSIYENIGGNENNTFANPFKSTIFIENIDLTFTYPILNMIGNINPYQKYHEHQNTEICRNKENKTPGHYFPKCRSWYYDNDELYKKYNTNSSISVFREFSEKNKSGISITKRSINNGSKIRKINIDLPIEMLFKSLDLINQNVDGYFYITRIGCDYPVYYPGIINQTILNSISRFEFNNQTNFKLNELSYFKKNILPKLKEYKKNYTNFTVDDKNIYHSFNRSNSKTNLIIIPIFFYTNDSNDSKTSLIHNLNQIYVYSEPNISKSLETYSVSNITLLVLQIIILVILATIFIFQMRHFNVLISNDIINPIRNLSNLLKGMKDNYNKEHEEENTQLTPDQSSSDKQLKLITPRKNKSSFTFNQKIKEKVDKQDEDLNENEDEVSILRSRQLDELFDLMFKLKFVMGFTTEQTDEVKNDNQMLNYIFSRTTFKDVKNIKGQNLCDSNIGNLCLQMMKYDKSIFHLSKSINEYSLIISLLNDINKYYSSIKEIKTVCSRLNSDIPDEYVKIKKIELNFLIKGNKLDDRFPKILKAYKNYFEFVILYMLISKKINREMNLYNKLGHEKQDLILSYFTLNPYSTYYKIKQSLSSNNNQTIENLLIFEKDIFCSTGQINLIQYENYILQFLTYSYLVNKFKQAILCLLEYIEFLLNFKFPSIEEYNQLYKQGRVIKKDEIEMTCKKIYESIGEIEVYIRRNNTTDKENYIDFMKNFQSSIEDLPLNTNLFTEVPISIVNSKLNLLKGKFYERIGKYAKSFEFYYKEFNNKNYIIDVTDKITSVNFLINILEKSNYFLVDMKNSVELFSKSHDINEYDYLLGEEHEKGRSNEVKDSNTRKILDKSRLLSSFTEKITKIEDFLKRTRKEKEKIDVLNHKDKQILICLDESLLVNPKKLETTKEFLIDFYNTSITNSDFFSIAYFGRSFNILLPYIKKSSEFEKFIIHDLKLISHDMNSNKKPKFLKALYLSLFYIVKKSINLSSPKKIWLIFLIDSIDETELLSINQMKIPLIFQQFTQLKENLNLALVSFCKGSSIYKQNTSETTNENKLNLNGELFKSVFNLTLNLANEEIEELKEKFISIGHPQEELDFLNEKYNFK